MLKRNKNGFTLIELIVVMAIIGILVLLAMPKFLGYTQRARITNIRHDVKVAENKVEEYLIKYHKLPDEWLNVDKNELEIAKEERKLYGKGGLVHEENPKEKEIEPGDYKLIPDSFVKVEIRSRLKGAFYTNNKGKVYYKDTKTGKPNIEPDEPNIEPDEPNIEPDEPEENNCPVLECKNIEPIDLNLDGKILIPEEERQFFDGKEFLTLREYLIDYYDTDNIYQIEEEGYFIRSYKINGIEYLYEAYVHGGENYFTIDIYIAKLEDYYNVKTLNLDGLNENEYFLFYYDCTETDRKEHGNPNLVPVCYQDVDFNGRLEGCPYKGVPWKIGGLQ